MKHALLYLVFAFAYPLSHTSAQVLPADSLALVDLYHSTNGENWTEKTGWLTATPVEQWHGITVQNGRVTEIRLYDNNLAGALPTSIGTLTGLRLIDMGVNQLSGELPESMGDMAALESLNLIVNQLTGSLPATFSNLTELQDLTIYRNELSGPFPEVVFTLSKLVHLDLASNNYSGPLPPALEQMSQLEYLGLDRNAFSGSMIYMGNFVNMTEAHFDFNQLTGNLQEFMGYLPQMYYLSMSGNQFRGCLSEFYFNPDRLTYLYFSYCGLRCIGDFSDHNLSRLHVDGNALTFDDLEPNFGIGLILYNPQDSTLSFIDTLLEVGQSFSMEAGSGGVFTQYQWYFNGAELDGATEEMLTIDDFDASKAGAYYSVMTNTQFPNLQLVRRHVLLRLDGASHVGTDPTSSLRVYPNPVSAYLHIECPGYSGRVDVVDQLGRVVFGDTFHDQHLIDVREWHTGVYYVRMKNTYSAVMIHQNQ